jgi:hypothetical protein
VTIDANGFDDAFYVNLKATAGSHGIDPLAFIQLVACECDLYPHVKNRYGYMGITQIGQSELLELGYLDPRPFHTLLPSEQLGWSFKYFDGWRYRKLGGATWLSAGQMWSANLAPARLGRPDGLVYSKVDNPGQYAPNSWTDVNRDGVIDIHDLQDAIQLVIDGKMPGRHETAARYQLAVTRLNAAGSPSTVA